MVSIHRKNRSFCPDFCVILAAGVVVRVSTHLAANRFIGTQVLLYDHLLTFDQELRLIWPAKTTIPKLLFLFNRYAIPIAMLLRTNGNYLNFEALHRIQLTQESL